MRFCYLYRIPKTVGVSIPMKATFFITYIMVDGWAGIAAEILRLVPLIVFHLKNTFLVKTDQDREQAMDPGSLDFAICEPRIQLYFLLGLVYAVVAPILLPFIIVFFAFSYIVFRHQVHRLSKQYIKDPKNYICLFIPPHNVAPILLPFIIVFFTFSYIVFRLRDIG